MPIVSLNVPFLCVSGFCLIAACACVWKIRSDWRCTWTAGLLLVAGGVAALFAIQ